MEKDRKVELDAALNAEQPLSAPTVSPLSTATRTTERHVEPTTAGASPPSANPGNSLTTDN